MITAEITDKELYSIIDTLQKDEMVIFVMADGRVRGALFHGTRFVNQMRAQHNLGILETMVLGQGCLCGAMLIPMMKGRERLAWRYEVEGPARGFSIESDSSGSVRGYLLTDHIPVEKPLDDWDLAPFLGDGMMTFITMQEGDKESQTSTVDIHNKNIALDLAYYFAQSEQIKTAFNTSIQMDKQGRVVGAGGLFLQVLPETGGTKKIGSQVASSANWKDDEELLSKVELAFKTAPSLGKWFSEGGTITDLVYGLFREFKPTIAVRRSIKYDCPCSEETYIKYIRSLPKEQLEDIKKNGPDPVEVICHNCGSVYHIPVHKL
jgi:molecular chaperone Hsp33